MAIKKSKVMDLGDGQLLYNDLRNRIENIDVAEDIIVVQDETPTNPDTVIWLPETQPEGVQVATYAELTAVEEAKADTSIIAHNYADLTFPVSAGTLCMHQGSLYKANQAISTQEEFDSDHWDETNVADENSALKNQINAIDVVLPKVESDWGIYTYTKTSQHYINRETGEEAASAYADYIAIPYDGKDYKVTGTFSNNSLIAPILYVSGTGTVLGAEPSNSDTVLTNYELTIPSGTANIYLCFPVNGTPSVYVKGAEYVNVAKQQDVSVIEDTIEQINDVLPIENSWETQSYASTSGYRNRTTGEHKNSDYAYYTSIDYSNGDRYKVSLTSSLNVNIIPILYVNSLGAVISGEPTTGDATITLTDYELTIPNGTKTIYINWNAGTTPSVYKYVSGYAEIATKAELDEKLDAPSTSGTSGQILTADGQGGSEWNNLPVDATLTISGKAADAKAIGDRLGAIESKMPIVYNALSLTTVDGKYMQLSLSERTLSGYSYTYITFVSGKNYIVSTESACNQYLAPVIYVDGNGNLAGQYPTGTSSSNVTLSDELLVIPSNAVGMYVNHVGSTTALKVLEGGVVNIAPAVDYTQYTWNAIGDSITYNGRYEDEVNSILGLPYTNGGVSGSTLAINDTYMTGQSIVERVLAGTYSDADVWTVMGGLNDCLYDSSLGQLVATGSTFDKTTVYGALQAICEYILNLRAHPRLILMTPTQSVRDAWSASQHPTTMAQIRQAVIDVAEYYSVTCFDAWGKSGISAFNIQKGTNPTTSDGVHLNVLGADILGEKLALCIKDELFGIEDD